MINSNWEPPDFIPREQVIKDSNSVLAMPEIRVRQDEDVFRIRAVGMDWDIGVMVYEPEDASKIPQGADGKKVGVYLLPGGSGDYKSMERLALLLAGKLGYKVATMTYPGRLNLHAPSRDWPGDTIHADGTVRTPIWKKDELITPEQYDVIKDSSIKDRYGTRTLARAKPGTNFYYRMAGWPVAFEEGGKEAMRRNLPEGEYSIYVHGHSTGGPFVCMLSQRVPNIAGAIAIENSSFGYIGEAKLAWGGSLGKVAGYDMGPKTETRRVDPFNDLYIRTWRDRARYAGPEALGQQGPKALIRLPSLMEAVLESWEKEKMRPQFKAEYIVTHNIVGSLTEAAQASAKRLDMSPKETESLVKRYLGYPRELSGPGTKPLPPFLFGISLNSRDHSPEVYKEVEIPIFKAMKPAPRVTVTQFDAGVHRYMTSEKDLPMGIGPAVIKFWHDAITGGFFVAR